MRTVFIFWDGVGRWFISFRESHRYHGSRLGRDSIKKLRAYVPGMFKKKNVFRAGHLACVWFYYSCTSVVSS